MWPEGQKPFLRGKGSDTWKGSDTCKLQLLIDLRSRDYASIAPKGVMNYEAVEMMATLNIVRTYGHYYERGRRAPADAGSIVAPSFYDGTGSFVWS